MVENLSASQNFKLDIHKTWMTSPVIFTVLIVSLAWAFKTWIYAKLALRTSGHFPQDFYQQIKKHLLQKQFDEALKICELKLNFAASIIACGIASRKYGSKVITKAMQAEQKRTSQFLWKKLVILKNIAIISPILGLLGTLVSLFYAFKEAQAPKEIFTFLLNTFTPLLPTTLFGLLVAFITALFYISLKKHVTKSLKYIENETLNLGTFIQSETVFSA
ncbi:MAG: hypothetical protein S4CHLAM7_04170 [Chlamydiae bacterium]|nr:hypothetical protein [Chlamydiota bacterium]